MKKSLFQRGSSLGRSVRFLTPWNLRTGGIALVVVLTVVLVRIFSPGFFTTLFAPLWNAGERGTASVGAVGTFFTDKRELALERDRVQTENDGLTRENGALRARVADLTALLGSRTEKNPGIVGGVLARPPVSPYDVLVIDVGTGDGVKTGAQVFGNGGTPLGTVASVNETSARVLLYSAPGRETAAWVGEKRIAGSLKGEGSGAFSMLITREAGIVVGDPILIPGAGALPVGTVIGVEDDPAAPRARVRVRPISNPFSVSWVTIASGTAL